MKLTSLLRRHTPLDQSVMTCAALCSAVLLFAAHAFCFFNLTYSSGSVMLHVASGRSAQIAAGAVFRFHGEAVPIHPPLSRVENTAHEHGDAGLPSGRKLQSAVRGNHVLTQSAREVAGLIDDEIFQFFSHSAFSVLSRPY